MDSGNRGREKKIEEGRERKRGRGKMRGRGKRERFVTISVRDLQILKVIEV